MCVCNRPICDTCQRKPQPRAHAEVIKAWANGATIEVLQTDGGNWVEVQYPSWAAHYKYRIKPAAPDYAQIVYDAYAKALGITRSSLSMNAYKLWDAAASAVLEAYKAEQAK